MNCGSISPPCIEGPSSQVENGHSSLLLLQVVLLVLDDVVVLAAPDDVDLVERLLLLRLGEPRAQLQLLVHVADAALERADLHVGEERRPGGRLSNAMH